MHMTKPEVNEYIVVCRDLGSSPKIMVVLWLLGRQARNNTSNVDSFHLMFSLLDDGDSAIDVNLTECVWSFCTIHEL
jgi:hypothetical protein